MLRPTLVALVAVVLTAAPAAAREPDLTDLSVEVPDRRPEIHARIVAGVRL